MGRKKLMKTAGSLVAALCLGAAVASAQAASRRMSDAQIVQDLRAHLDELAAQDRFSGTVLLAKNGQLLFQHAYGFADHAFDARNTVETKFNLASMGKIFTAVAIMQLEQEGKLSVDDRLLKLVPDYPNKEVAAKITIGELLTHTSGLGDFFGPAFQNSNQAQYQTIESYLPLFASQPLLFEPGSRYSYSNAGYIVLGLVIERVSGESYNDYVREHIFAPAGMNNTGFWSAQDDVPNLALSYTSMFGGFRQGPAGAHRERSVNVSVARGASAGGAYSTVGDLLRFAQALAAHKLLDAAHTDELMTGKVLQVANPNAQGAAARQPDNGSKYGYGMHEEFINRARIVGHSGGAPGISTDLAIYPAEGYVSIELSNYDGGADLVNPRLRWELTGHALPQAAHVEAAALEGLAGTYKAPPSANSGMGMVIVMHGRFMPPPIKVKAEGDALVVDLGPGGGVHKYLPLSTTEFFDEDAPGTRLKFKVDGNGRTTNLSIAGSALNIADAPRLP